jgi:hypothetical protein
MLMHMKNAAPTLPVISVCILAIAAADAQALCRIPDATDSLRVTARRSQIPTDFVLPAYTTTFVNEDVIFVLLEDMSPTGIELRPSMGMDDDMPTMMLTEPLQPNSAYILCAGFGATTPEEADECEFVRTDDGVYDEEPPPAPEIKSVSVSGYYEPNPECGSGANATVVAISTSVPDEDVSTLVLRRTLGDDLEKLVRLEFVRSGVDEGFLADFSEEGGTATYAVSAIDLTGNQSATTTFEQYLGLPGACSCTGIFSSNPPFLALSLVVLFGSRSKQPRKPSKLRS